MMQCPECNIDYPVPLLADGKRASIRMSPAEIASRLPNCDTLVREKAGRELAETKLQAMQRQHESEQQASKEREASLQHQLAESNEKFKRQLDEQSTLLVDACSYLGCKLSATHYSKEE